MNENINFVQVSKYILNTASIAVPFIAYFYVNLTGFLWDLSLLTLIILMLIRPLNDIFPKLEFYRYLTLRKNLGILSAIIVVSFGVIHYIQLGFSQFLSMYFSLNYWSFSKNLFAAHLGELTGFILLITSNTFSVRLLKRNWKRVQRLSYVYFFCGSWYVFSSFGKTYAIIWLIVVFELTLFAYIKKRIDKKELESQSARESESQVAEVVRVISN